MNKIIEEQLKKCSFADLTNYNEASNTFFIKKYSKPQYLIGHCYLVKLPGEIINNHNTILATNWNNGGAPSFEYYKIFINKLIGKMAYADCLAYNWETKQNIPGAIWTGYLDIDTLTQIGEIK